MRKEQITRLQCIIAIASFIVAVAFAIAGFIVPPEGEVHESTLYLIAQFLLVTTSIFGVSTIVSGRGWKAEARKEESL